MTSLKTTEFNSFDQKEYQNYLFYYCENNHPFVVFTTCYCPLCESATEIQQLTADLKENENTHQILDNTYWELVGKVLLVNPELLI